MSTLVTNNKPKSLSRITAAMATGSIFEWYDFFIYTSLAVFFSKIFFPVGDVASLLVVLATLGAGLIFRPVGALLFGRLGDMIGRRKVFMSTIILMGVSTTLIGLTPGFDTIGWFAPVIVVFLRICQGLALGGELGGSITYMSEHTTKSNRGFYTSLMSSTTLIGLVMSVLVILATKLFITSEEFATWGWRIPFVASSVLLMISLIVRKQLSESPEFEKITPTKQPLTDLVTDPSSRKWLFVMLAVISGQAMAAYAAIIYPIFFLTKIINVSPDVAFPLLTLSFIACAVFTVLIGWLSDKIGRLNIMLFGMVLLVLTIFPLYYGLTTYANPSLAAAQKNVTVVLSGNDCKLNVVTKQTTECAKFKEFFFSKGVVYTHTASANGTLSVTINNEDPIVYDKFDATVAGKMISNYYPLKAEINNVNKPVVLSLLIYAALVMALVYAPTNALVAEMFETKIRFSSVAAVTSVSNGWFGGLLPMIVVLITALTGNIYFGLIYPVFVLVVAIVVSLIYYNQIEEKRNDVA